LATALESVRGQHHPLATLYPGKDPVPRAPRPVNYLGNMITYEGELDIDNKLNNFFKITVILNNVFRPKNP